ncbi:TRAP transporter small permease [Marinomonas dokdonensis]|uniref:TRAP transporter small permease n=1 Tax=Marinomonas dokdonensis TaxID=328224 RepID=UPI004055931B
MFLFLSRKFDKHFEEYVASFCIAVISICVISQVVLRYVFGTGLTWTEEVSSISMVWAVYMGASLGIRERYHVRILAFVMLFPKKISLIFIILGDVVLLSFCIFMIVAGYDYLYLLWSQPSYTPSLKIDLFWPHSIVVFGYILIIFRLLQLYCKWFFSDRKIAPGMPEEYSN